MLRALAQLAHDCGLCARVGVIRVRAKITSKSKQTDAGSRIGAFEVCFACQDGPFIGLTSRHFNPPSPFSPYLTY